MVMHGAPRTSDSVRPIAEQMREPAGRRAGEARAKLMPSMIRAEDRPRAPHRMGRGQRPRRGGAGPRR